jgi:hypothetical protein
MFHIKDVLVRIEAGQIWLISFPRKLQVKILDNTTVSLPTVSFLGLLGGLMISALA